PNLLPVAKVAADERVLNDVDVLHSREFGQFLKPQGHNVADRDLGRLELLGVVDAKEVKGRPRRFVGDLQGRLAEMKFVLCAEHVDGPFDLLIDRCRQVLSDLPQTKDVAFRVLQEVDDKFQRYDRRFRRGPPAAKDDMRLVCQPYRIEVSINQIRYSNQDRKSTRLNSSHVKISYAVFCLKKKKKTSKWIQA